MQLICGNIQSCLGFALVLQALSCYKDYSSSTSNPFKQDVSWCNRGLELVSKLSRCLCTFSGCSQVQVHWRTQLIMEIKTLRKCHLDVCCECCHPVSLATHRKHHSSWQSVCTAFRLFINMWHQSRQSSGGNISQAVLMLLQPFFSSINSKLQSALPLKGF